jgi:hypothetical protein
MMRRVCKICRTKFRPIRSDAEFCSSQCRQAAYRTRKKNASIEAPRRKAEGAKPYTDFYDYRGYAAYLRSLAQRYNAKVRFMGTSKGILAVEETPGALAAARVFWNGTVEEAVQLQQWRSTKLHSTDQEVVETILQPQLGGSFIQRECEKECRELMLQGARPVYLFEWDWEYHVATSPPALYLPSWDYGDRPEDDGLSSHQILELLAGGGYRVGKAT